MKAKGEEGMSETGMAYCEASKLNEGNFTQVNSLQVKIIHREKCTKTKSFVKKIIRFVCKTTRKIIQKCCVPKKYSLIEYIVTPMLETAGKVGLG